MGLVHLAEHRTSKDKVAMKQIDLEESQDILDLIIVEIEVMKGMNHPNLVNFKQVIMLFFLFNQKPSFRLLWMERSFSLQWSIWRAGT